MTKHVSSELYEGEKEELLHGIGQWQHEIWYTKSHILSEILEWDRYTDYVAVNKIGWEKDWDWEKYDNVPREVFVFDLHNEKEIGELLGTLFDASLEGYSIRYVSPDPLVGIYLEKRRKGGFGTNIDEEITTALSEYAAKHFG